MGELKDLSYCKIWQLLYMFVAPRQKTDLDLPSCPFYNIVPKYFSKDNSHRSSQHGTSESVIWPDHNYCYA